MKARSISIAALKVMSSTRQEEEMAELIKSTRRVPNGEMTDLDRKIRLYEAKYGMNSETMRAQVGDGTLGETPEICTWLMTIKLRERLAAITETQTR